MSDNLRRYRAIYQALKQGYPGEPSCHMARHLSTLAMFISGIVESKNSQLPSIAAKVPAEVKAASRIKRLSRWLDNDNLLEEVYFLPYADILLHHLALETVVLVMHGSGAGRGWAALMLHVLYKGRALPLAWQVRQGPKGLFPEALHIDLVELIQGLLLAGTAVVLLGDGACDGIDLQAKVAKAGWAYVCRTSSDTTASCEGERFRLDAMGACIQAGTVVAPVSHK